MEPHARMHKEIEPPRTAVWRSGGVEEWKSGSRFFHSSTLPLLVFLGVLGVLAVQGVAAQLETPPDGAVLFRDEVVAAERKLRWKGPELSDETLFAAAFSGLSWDPASSGAPLFLRSKSGIAYESAQIRLRGFQEARAGGRHKIAAPFAFSLVLDHDSLDAAAWKMAFDYADHFGVDFDAALVGILQAPQKLPLLPDYLYTAMDTLVHRSSPRLLPLFLTLADANDAYLRSRAVAGVGIAAFRTRERTESTYPGLPIPLKESSISAAQRRMIGEVLQRASEDSSYRVRAAAALALGLTGDDSDLPLLQRLAKDRAFISLSTDQKDPRRIHFPVRAQAAASLARFGKTIDSGGGALSGKDLAKAIRAGRDVTRDETGIRRELIGRVRFHDGLW